MAALQRHLPALGGPLRAQPLRVCCACVARRARPAAGCRLRAVPLRAGSGSEAVRSTLDDSANVLAAVERDLQRLLAFEQQNSRGIASLDQLLVRRSLYRFCQLSVLTLRCALAPLTEPVGGGGAIKCCHTGPARGAVACAAGTRAQGASLRESCRRLSLLARACKHSAHAPLRRRSVTRWTSWSGRRTCSSRSWRRRRSDCGCAWRLCTRPAKRPGLTTSLHAAPGAHAGRRRALQPGGSCAACSSHSASPFPSPAHPAAGCC
jgi:hypothetical protein